MAFDSLVEDDAQFLGGEDVDLLHFGAAALDVESAEEFFAVVWVEGAIEGDLVFLFDFEAGVSEFEGEIAVVGEDDEALAFQIESADVIDAGPVVWDQVEDGAAVFLIGSGADESGGFVEDSVKGLLGLDELIPDFDVVAGLDEGAEVIHGLSVDFDASFSNEGFDTAAGAESGGGKVAVEAHRKRKGGSSLGAVQNEFLKKVGAAWGRPGLWGWCLGRCWVGWNVGGVRGSGNLLKTLGKWFEKLCQRLVPFHNLRLHESEHSEEDGLSTLAVLPGVAAFEGESD